jgi:hypothetical protein
MYGFVHNIGCRLVNRTYEDIHYEETMKWILYREYVFIEMIVVMLFLFDLEMLNCGVLI